MSTSVLKALPGKLDIKLKRHSPSILYISGLSMAKIIDLVESIISKLATGKILIF